MNPLAERTLLSRSRWLLYLLMLLFWVVALPLQAATLNIAKPGSGTGLIDSAPAGITCGADCTGSYGAGTGVTLIATPDAASSFVGWSAGICAGQNRVCALNMTATNQTVAAYFAGASVVAGRSHSLALKSDGTVWAWGNNSTGQLGDGSTTDRWTPVQVSGLSGVIALAAGSEHSLALKSDGTVWAWGDNSNGQLGDGSTRNRFTPVQVSGLSGVIAIAGSTFHSLALKSDGTVWAWGLNWYGQLGDGSIDSRSTPVQVSGLSGVIAIAGGSDHSLALKSDGTVWAWGNNDYGQLGDGSKTTRSTPVQVSGLNDVIALAGGDYHSLALKSDGTVWAWGKNGYGQLGDGSTSDRLTPVQVSGLSGVIALAGGDYHSLALKRDGTVWAWGSNTYGQLGDGSTSNRFTPVQVRGLSGVIAIAAGDSHSLALKSDGTVWAWGRNNSGQLGDGSKTTRSTPVQVRGLSGVIALAGGSDHSLALKSDGTVWAWGGDNDYGVGKGCRTGRGGGGCPAPAPVQVRGLSGVIALAAGDSHSLALKSDGTVWAWGSNSYGQLGDGSTTDRWTPVQTLGAGGSGFLNLHQATSPAVASRQTNIATRGWAGTGDSVMIAGFVISGDQPKKVLITAKGPVLATAGVPSVLADPNLTLYDSAGQQIEFNENWQSASNASAVAALGRGMRADFPQEAALLTTLNPGAYTAIVRGAGATTGNALVEVFDEDSSSTSKLINIATRGWAGTGDSVMIAGFVISGSQNKKVLITAKGPVLATAGVPSVLADPNLTLYDSTGKPIQFNENWQSASNASEVAALGRGMRTDFPQEAALLTTLAPGAYTAIVRGAGTTTGNALVEVFDQD